MLRIVVVSTRQPSQSRLRFSVTEDHSVADAARALPGLVAGIACVLRVAGALDRANIAYDSGEHHNSEETISILTAHAGDNANRYIEPVNRARAEVRGSDIPIEMVSLHRSVAERAQLYVRVNVELSERRPCGGRAVTVDAAGAGARLTHALIIAAGAGPDAAMPTGRKLHGVALAVLHDETAGLGVVVDDFRVETGVDLLIAVVDELHAGTA